jgi:hypothetical protein
MTLFYFYWQTKILCFCSKSAFNIALHRPAVSEDCQNLNFQKKILIIFLLRRNVEKTQYCAYFE